MYHPALTAPIIATLALSACQAQSQQPMPIPPNISMDRCNFLPFAGERLFSFDGQTQMSIDIRQNGNHATVKDGQSIVAQGGYDPDQGLATEHNGKVSGFYRIVFEDDGGQRHPAGLLEKLQADGKSIDIGCDASNPNAPCRTKLYGGNAVKACEEWRLHPHATAVSPGGA